MEEEYENEEDDEEGEEGGDVDDDPLALCEVGFKQVEEDLEIKLF